MQRVVDRDQGAEVAPGQVGVGDEPGHQRFDESDVKGVHTSCRRQVFAGPSTSPRYAAKLLRLAFGRRLLEGEVTGHSLARPTPILLKLALE